MKNNQLEKLSDYADYSKAKISIAEIDTKCYFSTENMLPNKGGVTEAAGLPTQDNVTKVLPENVLVSNIRPYFKKIYFANELAGASNDVLCFVAKNGCLPRYLYYLLSSDSFFDYMMAGAKGTKMPRGDKGQIMNFPVWVPAQNEQSRIVSVLSALDEKIENISQINHNLEEQAKAIYATYFPYSVDDALPDDWRKGTLGEIIDLHDSKRIPLSGNERGKMEKIYPYYGAASLMDYVNDYLFDGVFLLLGEDGTVVTDNGLPVLQYVWGKFWVNNHAHILTGKAGFSVESLLLLLKQTPVKSIVTGAVQPKISQANLKSIQIVIPPEKLLQEFNSVITPLFALIRQNSEESKRLTQLRDSLLPKLMSGEIDVSEVEI